LAVTLVEKLNLYKLRAKVLIEDLTEILGVLAVWDGAGTTTQGLSFADPRLPALGFRVMIPPHRAAMAASEVGIALVSAEDYEAHRIALGVPRGGLDFAYGDAFPHEADMDQLGGVDFAKGCYVGQEVVSRIDHRGIARTRAVALRYDGAPPESGAPITAGERQVGTMGSAARGRGIALIRLDRVAEAEPASLTAGGISIRLIKPDWARFSFPGEIKATE
jgi:folate-binding protein YgfZ